MKRGKIMTLNVAKLIDEAKKEILPNLLNPLTKLLLVTTIIIITLVSKNLHVQVSIIILCLILVVKTKMKVKVIVTSTILLTFFVLIGVVIISLFSEIENKLIIFILAESRILSGFYSISWFFNTVTSYELLLALESVHFPKKLNWLIIFIYQFIPIIALEAKKINDLRRLKGLNISVKNVVETKKSIDGILYPLIIGSINVSIENAQMLIIRGYSIEGKRTTYLTLKKKNENILCVIVIIILFCTWLCLELNSLL